MADKQIDKRDIPAWLRQLAREDAEAPGGRADQQVKGV